jgi:hypothetical protein
MAINLKKLESVLESTELLKDYVDAPYIMSGGQSFDDESELVEYLQERINECEVVYYTNAIKLLAEHDPSLMQSMELASEYGFSVDKLNSEVLATLLLQSMLNYELSKTDFSECFEA